MNITQIPQRIEIAFWETFISLMEDSTQVRFLMQESYAWFEKINQVSHILMMIVWAMAGLGLGFLIGLLVTTLI
ncbi:MAG: hypothetical protein P8074_20830 [Anaerolineales bacterium]|jgi:hypothetical protein